ncbi:MAG: hypothetical protein JSS04_13375 [Proteobacteria bacterium]|nr:hypothetical protein [Pseudomonadota bacterium]
MMRAVIGTVVVLAGLAVLEESVDASTGLAGSCKAAQAYALMPAGEPLVVRATPTPEGAVVGMIVPREMARDLSSATVTMIGSQGGWAHIVVGGPDYTAIDKVTRQTGWIPADALSVDTHLDTPVKIYDRPGLLGHGIGKVQDMQFRVLGCKGEFLQVINADKGNVWLDRWCSRQDGCRG